MLQRQSGRGQCRRPRMPTADRAGDGPLLPRCHRVPAAGPGATGRPMNTAGGRAARGRIGSASASQPPARSFPRLVCGWGLDISRRPACGRTNEPSPLGPFPLPLFLLERRCASPAAPARPGMAPPSSQNAGRAPCPSPLISRGQHACPAPALVLAPVAERAAGSRQGRERGRTCHARDSLQPDGRGRPLPLRARGDRGTWSASPARPAVAETPRET
jgi:hypothetical protein